MSKEVFRFIGVKKGRSWRVAPARIFLTMFFILLFCGYIIKWSGNEYISEADLGTLAGLLFGYLYVYTNREKKPESE